MPNTQFDSQEYRRALGQFPTGVAVVTANVDGEPIGMTSNSFASVSLEPPLILWSIKRTSQSFAAFLRSTHFCVNVLAEDQIQLSQQFAKSGPGKFKGVAFEEGIGKAPILEHAVAVFECRFEREIDGGDHVIMIGKVERFSRADADPLVFGRGRYASLAVHSADLCPANARMPQVRWPSATTSFSNDSLFPVLGGSYWTARDTFAEARRQAGVTQTEVRLLRGLRVWPSLALDALLSKLLIEQDAGRRCLLALEQRGYAGRDAEGGPHLTSAGDEFLDYVLLRVHDLENELLEGVDPDQLKVFRTVLSKLASRNRFIPS